MLLLWDYGRGDEGHLLVLWLLAFVVSLDQFYCNAPQQAEIFLGVVYYQRLRHMVSDKSQVRSTGPTNALTRQPVKGRKLGGGIRFGEMERYSLISHGTSYLPNDR